MGDVSFKPLIEDMTWSWSRISCFNDCPYRWYIKYIKNDQEIPLFYASYGKFMHKLLEKYYKNEISKEEMKIKFLFDFSKEVEGARPSESIVQSYINKGLDYLDGFEPLPYEVLGVEKRIDFEVGGKKFVGFIDYIGKSGDDIIIVDNKSRELSPRSKKYSSKPTKKDLELDEMLKQLYLYSAGVKQVYGKFPKSLCFNCFKNKVFIEEPFDRDKYEENMDWILRKIGRIEDSSDFYPNVDFFQCLYLCPYHDECCYWEQR